VPFSSYSASSVKSGHFNPPDLHFVAPVGCDPVAGAIVRHYLRDPTFSRFDTIPECDSQIQDDGIYCASIASHNKNSGINTSLVWEWRLEPMSIIYVFCISV